MTARGIRNNNPGNIRFNAQITWVGQIGVDDHGFVIFDTIENGIRAIAKIMLSYADKRGLKTVKDIIARWAPPSENDTASYIGHVCNCMSVTPDRVIDVHCLSVMSELVEGIIVHENGSQPYTAAEIMRGCNLALQGK